MAGALRRNVAWQLLQTLFSTGTELAIILIFAAVMVPTQFGAVAVALSMTKLALLVFEPRVHEFLTPKLSRYLGRSDRAAWMLTRWAVRLELSLNATAFVVCVGLAVAAPHVSSQFDTTLVLSAAAYNVANTLMKFSGLAVLRCLGEVRIAAGLAVGSGMFKLSLVGLAVAMQWSVPALLGVLSVVACLGSVAQVVGALRRLGQRTGEIILRPRRALRPDNWRKQRGLLLSNYATGVVELMHRELDVQIAAWLAGPEQAGRYRLAKTLAMTMMEALNPIVLVLLPDLARRIAFDAPETVLAFVRRISKVMAGIGGVAAVAVLLATQVYLRVFAPQQHSAWWPVLLLVCVLAVLAPWMWCQALLVAAGKPGAYMRGSALGAALAILLACWLAPRYGALGSSAAFAIGLCLTTALAARAAGAQLRVERVRPVARGRG